MISTDKESQVMYKHLFMEHSDGPILYNLALDLSSGNQFPTCVFIDMRQNTRFSTLGFDYNYCGTKTKYIICQTQSFEPDGKKSLPVKTLHGLETPNTHRNTDSSTTQNDQSDFQKSVVWSLQTIDCPLGHQTFTYLRCDELSDCFSQGML